jgi:hypothetical protein
MHFARGHASFVRTLDACSESGCHPHGSTRAPNLPVPATVVALAKSSPGATVSTTEKQRQHHAHVLAARRFAIQHAAALASRTVQGTRKRDVNDPVGAPGDALARRGRGRSRLGSVPAPTLLMTGAAQNAAPFTRGARAEVLAVPAGLRPARGGARHISTERSRGDQGVERGG